MSLYRDRMRDGTLCTRSRCFPILDDLENLQLGRLTILGTRTRWTALGLLKRASCVPGIDCRWTLNDIEEHYRKTR